MRNLIGISLGTRLLGIAVVYDGELYDYRVRTFYDKWTEKKRQAVIRTIKQTVARYGAEKILVKVPPAAHSSLNIHHLMNDIRMLAEQSGITLTICTIDHLKDLYKDSGVGNKQQLPEVIAQQFPQHQKLVQLLQKERSNRNEYYIKLFEAIACAEIGLRAGK